jgi:hypothetical protein
VSQSGRDLTRARLRRAARAVSSPTDAALAARMIAWALALPVLKVALPLRRLVVLMAVAGAPAARDAEAERAIATLARLTHRAVGLGRRDNCLERSLLAYRYLASANADPVLVVGTCVGSRAVEGHVWLTVDGRPVHDESAAVARFTPVIAFDATGAPLPVVAVSP